MILSNNNGTFTPVAGGNGTFIGTKAAFDAVKATLPDNTVAYITDDGNGDLQPVDAVTNGDMHPVTSNAVYDTIATLSPFNKAPSVVASTGAPDTSQVEQWTATKDCWVTAGVLTTASNGRAAINLSRDGGTTYSGIFGVTGQAASSNWPITLGFPVKKGWIVQIVGCYGSIVAWI